MKSRLGLAALTGLCLSALSFDARAANPPQVASDDMAVPPPVGEIYGGADAQTCAWPTTVAVTNGGGLCSGTIIHPEVVVYAAHCGASSGTRIRLGETSSNNPVTLTPEFCRSYPDYFTAGDQDVDWAFCKLSSPLGIPVTPPVMGCEYGDLNYGTQVAIVGYGNNQSGGNDGFGAGRKRWAMATLIGVNIPDNVAAVSESGEPAICSGDSGGPAFARMADGSWHAFGITSTGPGGCEPNAGRIHSLISGAVPWIEEQSGVDVTPCTDAHGNWAPNSQCQGFNASEPGAAFGTWNDGCVGGPVSGIGTYCGAGFDQPQDTTPPTVVINSPQWGDSYPDDPSEVMMDISVTDDGLVKGIRIEINGEDIGVFDDDEPYAFPATFPAGVYEIVAIGEDWSGNSSRSDAVMIEVGGDGSTLPPDPTTSGGSESTSTTGDDTASGEVGTFGETGDGPGANEDPQGCACSAEGQAPAGAAWLGLFGLLAWRRRRS